MTKKKFFRGRRLRQTKTIRNLVAENSFDNSSLIYPLFVKYGKNVREEIGSMPGQFRYSVDQLAKELTKLLELGISSVILFGIPETKDEKGSGAYDPEGIVQRAIREIKKELPEMLVVADVCLCEYTTHGHCGLVEQNKILNDQSLVLLADTAESLAKAGADIIAPSDMMDGRVGEIRERLDGQGFEQLPIMAYSAKYASSFYGPFRDAADGAPQFGDRASYQLAITNRRDALAEMTADLNEGADILMVKPALAYLDIIAAARERFNCPIAAYNVSGEYSMVLAAAEKGYIDREKVALEIITAINRAGADIIISYHAPQLAKLIGGKG